MTLASQRSINLPNDATQLHLVCNKPTLLYWAHSALLRDFFQGFSFACIYTEWFRSQDNLPNLDFEVRILSTVPKSIAGILTAHNSLCYQKTSILGNIARGEADLVAGAPWPDPQSYKLLSTCRTIIIVLDSLMPMRTPTLTVILGLLVTSTDVVSYWFKQATSLEKTRAVSTSRQEWHYSE